MNASLLFRTAVNRAYPLSILAVAVGLFAVASCGDKDKSAAVRGGGEEARPESGESESLVLYSWSEYFSEDLLAAFTERTGIKVTYEEFETTDELQEVLKSSPGRYDVVVIDDVTIRSLVDARLLQELDRTKLTHFANLSERYLTDETGKGGKPTFGAPYMWGTTLIAYRNDKLAEPKESWTLLFEEGLKGKVALLGERIECYPAALYALGLDPNSQNPGELDRVTALLTEGASNGHLQFGSDDDVMDALREGTADVAMLYSGDAARLVDEEVPIDFFIPSEGAMLWTDNFVIPRDSEKAEVAHKFIDFMLEAESAADSSNYVWYATPNKEALEGIDPELRGDRRIFPEDEVLDRCKFIRPWDSATERLVNLGWSKVQRAFLGRESEKPVAGIESSP